VNSPRGTIRCDSVAVVVVAAAAAAAELLLVYRYAFQQNRLKAWQQSSAILVELWNTKLTSPEMVKGLLLNTDSFMR
jgi:hypothetical protein